MLVAGDAHGLRVGLTGMGAFLSTLRAEKVAEPNALGRARWRLVEPLRFRSDVLDEVVEVPAGFETDYASVPRLPFAYWLAGDSAHAAAVVHDWLVGSVSTSRGWRQAARVFAEAMAAEGVAPWRRAAMYWIVAGADPYQRHDEGGGAWDA